MRKNVLVAAVGLVAPFLLNPGAYAAEAEQEQMQGQMQPGAMMPTRVTPTEMRALGRLHAMNKMEMETGDLATKNSENPRIQQFGQTLTSDHQAADKMVTDFAQKYNVDLETQKKGSAEMKMEKAERAEVDRLKGMKGAEFDRAFLTYEVKAHEQGIQLLNRTKAQTKNTELGSLVDQLLPAYKAHRDMAKALITPRRVGRRPAATP